MNKGTPMNRTWPDLPYNIYVATGPIPLMLIKAILRIFLMPFVHFLSLITLATIEAAAIEWERLSPFISGI